MGAHLIILKTCLFVELINFFYCNKKIVGLALFFMDRSLIKACRNGDFDEAQKLINCGADIESALYNACNDGRLDIAKWLLRMKPSMLLRMKSSIKKDLIFRWSCFLGRFDFAKWLLSVDPSINVRLDGDQSFIWACGCGHLKIAKWLLSVEPSIDVRAGNDEAFRWAYDGTRHNVAKWLKRVEPAIKYSMKPFDSRRVVQLISFFS